MSLRKVFVFPVVAVLLAACAAPPAEPQVDVAAEQEAIRAIVAEWLVAEQAKDAARVVALFAPDGQVQWTGNEVAVGPAAIQARLEADWAEDPDATVDFGSDRIVVSAAGDMAVDFGHWSTTGTDGEDHGRYVTIYRKVDGAWKADTDITMSAKPDEDGMSGEHGG